jgi:hypothetical protein
MSFHFDNSGLSRIFLSRNDFVEMGYFRIKAGENILGIEEEIVWATPGQFTTMNYPCNEDGTDCGRTSRTKFYADPSSNFEIK